MARKNYPFAIEQALQRLAEGEELEEHVIECGVERYEKWARLLKLDPADETTGKKIAVTCLGLLFGRKKSPGRPRSKSVEEGKQLLIDYLKIFTSGTGLRPKEARLQLIRRRGGIGKDDTIAKALRAAVAREGLGYTVLKERLSALSALDTLHYLQSALPRPDVWRLLTSPNKDVQRAMLDVVLFVAIMEAGFRPAADRARI